MFTPMYSGMLDTPFKFHNVDVKKAESILETFEQVLQDKQQEKLMGIMGRLLLFYDYSFYDFESAAEQSKL
ncbi:hypothetical protein ANCDUO_21729 [Ancylostoma duodenale]|uniref:Uncharacterized protein n=1 Tax=Ancylostoma duodenale TaxID=51022 RepID=A0A0C2FHY1_9BILA|nr:hypothetical protein ANCDUO_21729 [Ancylostoma duodenale]